MPKAHPSVTGRRFLSRTHVAARYGVTPRTTYRWEEEGVLPPPDRRVNNRDYWDEANLDKHDRKRTFAAGNKGGRHERAAGRIEE